MMPNSNLPVCCQEEMQAMVTLTVADGLILPASAVMTVGVIDSARVVPVAAVDAASINPFSRSFTRRMRSRAP